MPVYFAEKLIVARTVERGRTRCGVLVLLLVAVGWLGISKFGPRYNVGSASWGATLYRVWSCLPGLGTAEVAKLLRSIEKIAPFNWWR